MAESTKIPDFMAGGMKRVPVIDLKNATQKLCDCGCGYFQPVVMVYTVSALVSPTGKELEAQRPALMCTACRKVLGEKKE